MGNWLCSKRYQSDDTNLSNMSQPDVEEKITNNNIVNEEVTNNNIADEEVCDSNTVDKEVSDSNIVDKEVSDSNIVDKEVIDNNIVVTQDNNNNIDETDRRVPFSELSELPMISYQEYQHLFYSKKIFGLLVRTQINGQMMLLRVRGPSGEVTDEYDPRMRRCMATASSTGKQCRNSTKKNYCHAHALLGLNIRQCAALNLDTGIRCSARTRNDFCQSHAELEYKTVINF